MWFCICVHIWAALTCLADSSGERTVVVDSENMSTNACWLHLNIRSKAIIFWTGRTVQMADSSEWFRSKTPRTAREIQDCLAFSGIATNGANRTRRLLKMTRPIPIAKLCCHRWRWPVTNKFIWFRSGPSAVTTHLWLNSATSTLYSILETINPAISLDNNNSNDERRTLCAYSAWGRARARASCFHWLRETVPNTLHLSSGQSHLA